MDKDIIKKLKFKTQKLKKEICNILGTQDLISLMNNECPQINKKKPTTNHKRKKKN